MARLSTLFSPSSIAVIGASDKPASAGNIVFSNILNSEYSGVILPIHPKYRSVCGVLAYPSIEHAPLVPELAILCTSAETNAKLLLELAKAGVKTCVIVANHTDKSQQDTYGYTIDAAIAEARSSYKMRVLGPNSLGVIFPHAGMNLSLSPVSANKGSLAFVSQSAAICATVLDWAKDKGIGFSAFVSLGNGRDIDFADLLDELALDSKTSSILIYVDGINDARKFMSAARAASRNRRVLVVKGGRSLEGSVAALRHNSGPMGSLDVVFDSAIRRSGMLRVNNTHELFAAVETLTHSVPLKGERLTIITNGGGPAIMALDALVDRGGQLATISPELSQTLDKLVGGSSSNPIDLGGDANAKRYVDALTAVMDAEQTDAILLMHSPSVASPATETAQTLLEVIKQHPKRKRYNILTNWSGESSTIEARRLINQAGIPTYRTPESAALAFMHLVEYRRNQRQLMQTPSSLEAISSKQKRATIDWLTAKQRQETTTLFAHQAFELFRHYEFDVLPTWQAKTPNEAAQKASDIGFPVALKIQSKDLRHKSEVHGVQLNLRNELEVEVAAAEMQSRMQTEQPSAEMDGFIVQAMAARENGCEFRVKMTSDPVFGPVICIGQGGDDWDISKDASIGLPPLNHALARYLVINAIKARHLPIPQSPVEYSIDAVAEFLAKLSQLVIDCDVIKSIDIHPAIVSYSALKIIDAQVQLYSSSGHPREQLAIRPYPIELEENVQLKDGREIKLRPIRPEDEPEHGNFISRVSKEDLYKRFFTDVGELNHEALANLTQIDYDREMAFIAVTNDSNQIIGVSRVLAEPDLSSAEFAVLVQSDLKGVGLGKLLMSKIIDYSKHKGIGTITGMTMPTNRGMIGLAQHLGFSVAVDFEDGTADMTLEL